MATSFGVPINVPSALDAVVAADVDDQRVIELAHVLDRLDHAADLMVGVGQVRGVDFDLPDKHFLLVGGELSQCLSRSSGQGVSLASWRNHAELLLVGKDRFPQLVPAVVEQVHVADFLDPLGRRVMRRVGAAGSVVDKERAARDRSGLCWFM